MSDLQSTGERIIEDRYLGSAEEYLIYSMHLATYDHVLSLVDGKQVLDFGCGTGYGTERIAGRCASIVGVDISDEAVAYAREHYSAPSLTFEPIVPVEERALPFDDARFDVVLSFQVIEHVRDVDAYLFEARRVLRPGGVFVVATPDRSTRLLPGQRPWNRFHLVEYSKRSLSRRLSTHFSEVDVLTMSGRSDVIGAELRRTRLNMLLALPLTLPLTPEPVRVHGLGLLRRIKEAVRSRRRDDAAPRDFPFDERAIQIGHGLAPSMNLIAHCRGAVGDS